MLPLEVSVSERLMWELGSLRDDNVGERGERYASVVRGRSEAGLGLKAAVA